MQPLEEHMSSVNKVILVGHLGADPELRATGSGRAMCKFRIATNRSFKDAEGNKQDKVSWHRVVAWGKQAEICKRFLSKGRQVYVEGRLDHSSYEDPQGNKRYSTEVVSSSVVFLGAKGERRELMSESEPEEMPF